MKIRRVVPDASSDDLDSSRAFYRDFLGFEIGMDMDWVINCVSPDNPTAQVSETIGCDANFQPGHRIANSIAGTTVTALAMQATKSESCVTA